MGKLLGRETELAGIAAALEAARSTGVARAMSLSGPAGIGKTALVEEAEAKARQAGWLVAHVDVHRIRGTLPLAAAQHFTVGLLAALGPDAPRYTSGLPLATHGLDTTDPVAFRESVVRLVEGVLYDFPLLIGVDDAQWIDPESRAFVEELLRSFSDRSIALLATERAGELSAFADIADTVVLRPIAPDASAAIVAQRYPDAPIAVVDAILHHANGRPLEIVALSDAARENHVRDADAVHASARTAIADRLQHEPPPVREFLQMCSLISEPVDYATLTRIWPPDSVAEYIATASGRYLVQDGRSLRFVHSAIAESVRQTVPLETPYRRRIIAALAAVEAPTLEEYERIIEQALACGDNALAHRNLLLLAGRAARESAYATASTAYDRAFAIATPAPADLVRIYREYACVLNIQGRMNESAVVLERALADLAAFNIKSQTGAIAALFLVAQWGTKGYRAALHSAEPLLRRFKDPADREQVLSVVAWLYACADDRDGFESCKAELLERAGTLPHEIRMRLHIAEAHLAIHRGEVERASSAIESAVADAGSVVSANRHGAAVSQAMIHFWRFGTRNIDPLLRSLQSRRKSDRTQTPVLEYIRTLCAFAKGEIAYAHELLRDALSRPMDRASQLRLLGVEAAVCALTQSQSFYQPDIDDALAGFTGSPADHTLLPLASWHALSMSTSRPAEARDMLERVINALEDPTEVTTLHFPVALSLAAARLGDRGLLERLSTMTGMWHDRAPWMVAQRELAMGCAAKALGRPAAAGLLAAAHQSFVTFDAPFFAALAKRLDNANESEAGIFLPGSSSEQMQPRRKASMAPSRREMEIIALVADGHTNRGIAEKLFLSERTVESHIATIFNKLNVSSRTQVAAWYVTTQAVG